MGKKIIVAGLGHGGIAAASILAKRGFDVTVYEKKSQGTLGYDWTDIFAPAALGIAEMPMPPEDKYEYINLAWWESFNDPILNNYIVKAVDNNKDLKMATLTIDEFYQNVVAQRSSQLPTINIGHDCLLFSPCTCRL